MMSSKQKWFINKLVKEIDFKYGEESKKAKEAMLISEDAYMDSYRVSSKQASEMIKELLELKEEK